MPRDYVEELKLIIASNEEEDIKRSEILQYHESDIADALEELTKEERLMLYHILGDEIVSEIFAYLDDVEDYIEEISSEKAADIIELMDADDAIDILDELDEEDRDEIVSLMEPEVVEDIELIEQYQEEEIGSKMTNNFILISKTYRVKEAMKKVIKEAAENDNVSIIYVEDEFGKYFGALDLRDLIIARENDRLIDIIKQSYPSFYATELVEDIIVSLKDYELDSYPILNENNEVIGVLTASDVLEAIDEEMKDDYAKLAGLTEEEDLDESVFTSVRKRLPWLIVLLFMGLLVSGLISSFEEVVKTLPMIVFFQSLILGMAGNTGTQSLAVTIRLISDEEVSKKEVLKTIFKEVRIGLMNGSILGVLAFVFVLCFLFFTKQGVTSETFVLTEALKASMIVGVSLLIAMTICSVIGSIIPIIFKKIKIDPAVASGPFITTINDVLAVVIYYGLATLMFMMI